MLVTIEGIDGVGSTQISLLADIYKDAIITKELQVVCNFWKQIREFYYKIVVKYPTNSNFYYF